MKIIADAGYGKFIVEMDEREIRELADKYYGERFSPKTGMTLDVGKIYDQAYYIKDNPEKIKTVINNLEAIIKNLTLLQPFTAPEIPVEE